MVRVGRGERGADGHHGAEGTVRSCLLRGRRAAEDRTTDFHPGQQIEGIEHYLDYPAGVTMHVFPAQYAKTRTHLAPVSAMLRSLPAPMYGNILQSCVIQGFDDPNAYGVAKLTGYAT